MKPSIFRFNDPILTDLHFELNEHFTPESPELTEISSTTNVSVRKSAESNCSAIVSLKIDLPAEQRSAFPFFISATMSAQFNWDDGLPDETVESLLTKNAPALLLGYLRPWIANVTEAGPTSAIHIPFMDFTQEASEKKPK